MKQIIQPLVGYETNYDICGGGGGGTKQKMSRILEYYVYMINKTTNFYNTIYFIKSSVCS